MDKSIFGERVRKLRELRKISKEYLASTLNLSSNQIENFESGEEKPDFETLEGIADFFNVDIDYLLGRSKISHYLLPPEDVIFGDKEKELIEEFRELSEDKQKEAIRRVLDLALSEDEKEFLKKYKKLSAKRKIEIQERLRLETEE